ncbi:site-specific DNA-methyltransferase [Rhizobium sp. NTR19]|uniref:site-specific DNA-methyltransferase (adenine-specific) n=1 Tax=Neorhizobium turbinariae TaxID=2937795 RepID=A0ABT0IVH5_9HYPH|nr:site-specific DNA-methyltransferase [Neorhizobium turbinariae]MCK8781886.1 site-specific DNA-methyltransferase [Neorhizobium turbinariae]
MKKLELNDPETKSADVVSENISALQSLFPDAFCEGKVDFDVLKQLLGGAIDDREEKYGLNWHGKRQARQIALTPSVGTLLPCPEDSVDWERSRNLVIEGDNLEVLKLLQKSYSRKVKLIYMDPPYNTGGDFVYPDDFTDSIKSYLNLTGQIGGDGKISTNVESSGRFHTSWLNMMYPRLRLAKSLLTDDGLIFVSIDDGELANLRLAMDDIFGEERFLATFIWKSRQNKDNRTVTGASVDHEYIVAYGSRIRGSRRNVQQYSNIDNDPRGDWASANMVGIATADRRPNLHYDLINPTTGINYGCPDMGWRYDRTTMARLIAEDRILWPQSAEGRPRRKAFLSELESEFTGFSTVVGEALFTRDGTADIDKLFDVRVFNFPKPVQLIRTVIEQATFDDDIVVDLFAGSGTTAHATMLQNTLDKSARRFITVQLPEPLDPRNRDQKTAADFCAQIGKPQNIAELTKERLRRAGRKLRTESPSFDGDVGFRVFKLAQSNIRAWEPVPSDLEGTLLANAEHIVPGRTEKDILYELLLKLGLDLCVSIETREIAGKTVHAIGGGALIACLADGLTKDVVESLSAGIVAWWKELAPAVETRVVFKDSGFADDVAKTNMAAILNQNGILDVRSL